SILEHGWHQFETFLAYKLEAAGGRLVKVDPRNTSRKPSTFRLRQLRTRGACRRERSPQHSQGRNAAHGGDLLPPQIS
ncbi:zinc ribbon domain-containing protein, partial [Bradyrhizobium iriomotense]|uniref:zinc ribbon domain-containing protein n=1 Tax=Bradyrhizobium iriomotense TaxID=441950 RepID=UPI0024E0BBB1